MTATHNRQRLTAGEIAVAVAFVVFAVLVAVGIVALAFWAAEMPSGSRTVWFGGATAIGTPLAWESLKYGLFARARKRSRIVEQSQLHSPLVEDAMKAALDLQERDEALKGLDDVIAVRVARGLVRRRGEEIADRASQLVEEIATLKVAEKDLNLQEQRAPQLEDDVMKAVERLDQNLGPIEPKLVFSLSFASNANQFSRWIAWRVDRFRWERRTKKAETSEQAIERAAVASPPTELNSPGGTVAPRDVGDVADESVAPKKESTEGKTKT